MDEDWEVAVSFLPSDWEELARETGALKGLRKDKSPEALLRVLLLHLARGHSLRETVVRARAAKLADLSDVALLKRLRKSSEWLRELCAAMFREQGAVSASGGERFRAFDATTVKEPGRSGSLWRLHCSARLPSLACDFFRLTATEGAGVAETLAHFPIAPGDLVLADRGYSTATGLDHVASSGGHATVRVNTGALPLRSPEGTPLNLLERVAELRRPCVARAWPAVAVGKGVAVPGRVCAIRKTEAAARIAQRKARDHAARQGKQVRPSTLEFARHVILFTTFPMRTSTPAACSTGTASAGRSSRSSSASSRWRSSATCPGTRRRAPAPGFTESSSWRCWRRNWCATPAPLPPGEAPWQPRRHSPWRDFHLMHGVLARAIEPHLPLQQAIDDWHRMSAAMADPPRQRVPQVERCFEELPTQTSWRLWARRPPSGGRSLSRRWQLSGRRASRPPLTAFGCVPRRTPSR